MTDMTDGIMLPLPGIARFDISKIHCDSTHNWDTQTDLVSEKEALYVYTDALHIGSLTVPALKVGDGVTLLADLPFTGNVYGTGDGHTIVTEAGVAVAQRSNLKFLGATITDDSTNDTTVVAGLRGPQGPAGSTGPAGSDGISPTVSITPITGGYRLVITDAEGDHAADIMDGQTGPTGPAGADGQPGQPGADGISPTVSIIPISGGNRLTVTDATGSHTADIMNGTDGQNGSDGAPGRDGTDGQDGQDGVSPTVEITAISGGHRLTITDGSGAHTADILDGQTGPQGPAGTDGTDGTDGVTPSISASATVGTGTGNPSCTVTKTGTDAAPSFEFSFDGIKGATGPQGPQGNPGTNGTDGQDGTSPTVTITPITGGNRVTITDATGSHTADVMDGSDGQDGSNGQDGISPTVTITAITGGHRVTITDATGSHTADIMDGAAGTNGQDGRGIVSIIKTGTAGLVDTYTVTYTDSTTSTFTVTNGEDGDDYVLTNQDKSDIADIVYGLLTAASGQSF